MTINRPINEVLDELAALEAQPIQLEGVLEVSEEGYALKHYPKAERRAGYAAEECAYQSGVWIEFGNGSIRPNEIALERWQGKRVRVSGVIHGLPSLPSFGAAGKGGFGPWGAWPAAIEAYSIQRVTAEERREEGA